MAAEQARIDLQNAMGEFDRQVQEAEAQKGELAGNLSSTKGLYETQRSRAKTEAESQLSSAESSRLRETATATRTAKDVQGKNRNILRAMGILSSSAAGEMLGKPYEALQGVTANIGEVFTKRKQEVENWVAQRGQDIDAALGQVQQNYDNLIAQINRDIRYTGEQKASAVREAALGLRQVTSQLQAQAQANQQAAAQYQSQLLSQVAQLQLYQNPKADISGIMNQMISMGNSYMPSQSSQVLSDADARKRLGLA
jgi:hypothetical protein